MESYMYAAHVAPLPFLCIVVVRSACLYAWAGTQAISDSSHLPCIPSEAGSYGGHLVKGSIHNGGRNTATELYQSGG